MLGGNEAAERGSAGQYLCKTTPVAAKIGAKHRIPLPAKFPAREKSPAVLLPHESFGAAAVRIGVPFYT
ncbi:MAG: hypothetical protein C6W56_07970 [Caldibacillus debilis]|nr:MAG: hypothetical protein C6W56_07970 [Caldibacillus debilis]